MQQRKGNGRRGIAVARANPVFCRVKVLSTQNTPFKILLLPVAPNYFTKVFIRLGHFFLVVALVALMGGHWAVLQTVAWTAMMADNLETESFEEAVKNTFSGNRPCKLCKSIATGKQDEKKSDLPQFAKKFEFVSERPAIIFSAPDAFTLAPEFLVRSPLRTYRLPLPPPRVLPA